MRNVLIETFQQSPYMSHFCLTQLFSQDSINIVIMAITNAFLLSIVISTFFNFRNQALMS